MPSIRRSRDGKSYFIVAPAPAAELHAQIAHRIGPDEAAVEIDQQLLIRFILREKWRRLAERLRKLRRWRQHLADSAVEPALKANADCP